MHRVDALITSWTLPTTILQGTGDSFVMALIRSKCCSLLQEMRNCAEGTMADIGRDDPEEVNRGGTRGGMFKDEPEELQGVMESIVERLRRKWKLKAEEEKGRRR